MLSCRLVRRLGGTLNANVARVTQCGACAAGHAARLAKKRHIISPGSGAPLFTTIDNPRASAIPITSMIGVY